MRQDFKHENIYAALREKITSGEYASGGKLPGQVELMASYGVSCATISTALKALVDDGLIMRRRGAGTFVVDPSDRSRLRRRGAVSDTRLGLLCSHTLSHPVGVLKGICEEIADSGVGLEFVVYQGREQIPLVARRIVEREIKVDGCLVVTLQTGKEAVRIFQEHQFPYVITDAPCVYEGAHQILMDHRQGARMAVDHLLRHGHKRIALLDVAGPSPEADPWLHCKRAGYCDALTAAGLPVDRDLMASAPPRSAAPRCR